MSAEEKDVATCRGCRRQLKGHDYRYGGSAYHPETGKRCPSNHFGGFVCSESCDRRVILSMLSSMPGAGAATSVPRGMLNNWDELR